MQSHVSFDWARLAQCRRSGQGQRRLDDPDDWVRLEIAHALSRDITVIPVRVNGAELPLRANLPNDIRGLLDHQAVSVTLAGFRNEMSGLVRDIRSISNPWPWRHSRSYSGKDRCFCSCSAYLRFTQAPGARNAIERARLLVSSMLTGSTRSDDAWSGRGRPGEWVLYGTIGQKPALSHFFQPASVRTLWRSRRLQRALCAVCWRAQRRKRRQTLKAPMKM